MRKKKLTRLGLYNRSHAFGLRIVLFSARIFSDWGQSEAKSPADVETRTSLCLYSTSVTFHPTALLLSIRSKVPFSC